MKHDGNRARKEDIVQKIKNAIPYKRETSVLTQINAYKASVFFQTRMEIFARKVEKLWLGSLPADPRSIAINELQEKARLVFCKQETVLRGKKTHTHKNQNPKTCICL